MAGAPQEGPQATRAPQAPATYPADQIKAGEPLFAAHCGFCHGRDATGGATGPDLTRSIFVSEDVRGDKIKPLLPFAAVNWAKGIDKDGSPIPDPAKEPARDGRLVAPDEGGGTNYRSPSFDPATGLFIVSARDAYGIWFNKEEHGTCGWAGADYGVGGRGYIRALDYQTGKVKWDHPIGGGSGAGVLTTATGVTFTGDGSGNALALRTSDGSTLWHAAIGGVNNSPVTIEIDGRQHLLVGGGSALYAWRLPCEVAADSQIG